MGGAMVGITSKIPDGLFDNDPGITDYHKVFKNVKMDNNIRFLEIGDIFLVSKKNPWARLVQAVMGNPYNHAATKSFPKYKVITEALGSGINRTSLGHYRVLLDKGKCKIRLLVPKDSLSLSERAEYIRLSQHHVDKKTSYEFENLIFFQLVRYASKRILGKEIWLGTMGKRGANKFICGEWVMYLWYKTRGYFKDIWYKGSPRDIYESEHFIHYDVVKVIGNNHVQVELIKN